MQRQTRSKASGWRMWRGARGGRRGRPAGAGRWAAELGTAERRPEEAAVGDGRRGGGATVGDGRRAERRRCGAAVGKGQGSRGSRE